MDEGLQSDRAGVSPGRLSRSAGARQDSLSREKEGAASVKPAGDDQPCTIYLLRHGTTDHNSAGRLMGHLDVGPAPQGEKEARRRGRSATAVFRRSTPATYSVPT